MRSICILPFLLSAEILYAQKNQVFVDHEQKTITISTLGDYDNDSRYFALLKLKFNGRLDRSFGENQGYTVDVSPKNNYLSTSIQLSNGKFLASGYRVLENGKAITFSRMLNHKGHFVPIQENQHEMIYESQCDFLWPQETLDIPSEKKFIAVLMCSIKDLDVTFNLISKFDYNGKKDMSFGRNGNIYYQIGGYLGMLDYYQNLLSNPDGSFLVKNMRTIRKFDANGRSINDFGVDGIVTVANQSFIFSNRLLESFNKHFYLWGFDNTYIPKPEGHYVSHAAFKVLKPDFSVEPFNFDLDPVTQGREFTSVASMSPMDRANHSIVSLVDKNSPYPKILKFNQLLNKFDEFFGENGTYQAKCLYNGAHGSILETVPFGKNHENSLIVSMVYLRNDKTHRWEKVYLFEALDNAGHTLTDFGLNGCLSLAHEELIGITRK